MTQSAVILSIAGELAPERAPRRTRGPEARRAIALSGMGVAAWSTVVAIDIAHGFHPHPARLGLLLAIPAVLQLHITAAVLALGLGLALMVGAKGRAFHRVAGWTWVVCMATTAVSSFWIRDHGRFSAIHLLSGWVSVGAPIAVAAAKRRNVKRHRALMTGLFMGGLVVAGAFTFVPGRLMWRIFVG